MEGFTSVVTADSAADRQRSGASQDSGLLQERRAAARQIHRSMKAWRDRQEEESSDQSEKQTEEKGEAAADGGATDKAASEPASEAAADVKRKIHRAGDSKAAGSLKRLGKSGQDAAALKEALKQAQHERAGCVEQLAILKASLGKLGLNPEQMKVVTQKIKSAENGIADHLTDDDIAGAMRDAASDPVNAKGSGEPYDHAGEVRDGLKSLQKLRDELSKTRKALTEKSQIDPKNVAAVLDPVMDALQQTMQRVGQAIKKVKKK